MSYVHWLISTQLPVPDTIQSDREWWPLTSAPPGECQVGPSWRRPGRRPPAYASARLLPPATENILVDITVLQYNTRQTQDISKTGHCLLE